MKVLKLREGWQVLLYLCQQKIMETPRMVPDTRVRMSGQNLHLYLETVEQNLFFNSGKYTVV